ncbi:MAG: hypothetical protein PHF20_01320 [Halothiobacillaceae bacterium]|nr:hypothetical protein [Halothiobacillaceae bacterium]
MDLQVGQPIAYHELFSEEDLVVLQVERYQVEGLQTFVFDGFDSMEKCALENPDIPLSVWGTLTEMQSELNASKGI